MEHEEVQNSSLFDKWTPLHLLAGYVIGKTFRNRGLGIVIIVGVEVVENLILRKQFAEFFKEQELAPNIASDIFFSYIGMEIALRT